MRYIDLDKHQEFVLTKRGNLAQLEIPAAPTAVYALPEDTRTEIFGGEMMVVNRSNQNRWLTIWFDNDGAATGNPELIHFQIDVPAKGKIISVLTLYMDTPGGTLSMEAEQATDLIVTVFGSEYKPL